MRQDFMPLPSFTDGLRNGTESAVDLGGECEPCDGELECTRGEEYLNGVCTNSDCVAPASLDSVQNGREPFLPIFLQNPGRGLPPKRR